MKAYPKKIFADEWGVAVEVTCPLPVSERFIETPTGSITSDAFRRWVRELALEGKTVTVRTWGGKTWQSKLGSHHRTVNAEHNPVTIFFRTAERTEADKGPIHYDDPWEEALYGDEI